MSAPKLLDQVRIVARLKHLSLRTEKAYIHQIKRFILFHHNGTHRNWEKTICRTYLSHLAVERNVAASTQNVAFAALLFLYRDVLKRSLERIGEVERARLPSRLPVVFTKAEAISIIQKLSAEPFLGCWLDVWLWVAPARVSQATE